MPHPAERPAAPQSACAFCGYRTSTAPVQTPSGASCCSEQCRTAYENDEQPFTEGVDYKWFSPGVSVLDSLLPQGIPANSFVLLAGVEGIRHRGLQTELVWRTLTREEPAIIVTFVDPAVAIVEHFLTFGWNVLPFLEAGDLHIIDCFTSRLRDEHQTPKHQAAWNEFLGRFLDGSVTVIEEPSNLRAMEDALHSRLEAAEMIGQGIVIIDSLNEVERQGQETETNQFIKEVRGDICSRKFVPIFASATTTERGRIEKENTYLFDGIVEMRRNESLIEGVRLKQLSVRKMDGVLYHPDWIAYENATGSGFQMFDPVADLTTVYGTLSQSDQPATQPERSPPRRRPTR